ncbi:MAG TPA: Gfo/Idh/MocA family oxidoreductase [Armatimonadetes bacterium]|nr:Gfo/Idh/MocA family oxidoreductase [Armatimonadota bacterium]
MSEPLKIGIVGCGRILPAHLHGFQILREAGFDHFRITALVARKIEDALRFRRRGEGPPPRPPVSQAPGDPLGRPHLYVSDFQDDVEVEVYDDYREMLEKAEVDAVEIYTSLFNHHEIALAALEAGKHVMVQKPMAISVRAARAMIEAAERAGKVLSVAECARYGAETRQAKWALEQGLLGEVEMVAQVSLGSFWSPDKIVADTPWRHQKLLGGGGGSVDLGVHFFHVLRYLCGELDEICALTKCFEPRRYKRDEAGNVILECSCDVDDAFFANFSFQSGAIGHITWTWAGHGEPVSLPGGRVIYGTKGCLKEGQLILDEGTRYSLSEVFAAEAPEELKERWFPRGITDIFALEELDFQQAIATGAHTETHGKEGLKDLAASFAILESATLKRAVRVADVESSAVDAYQREIDEHYGLVG